MFDVLSSSDLQPKSGRIRPLYITAMVVYWLLTTCSLSAFMQTACAAENRQDVLSEEILQKEIEKIEQSKELKEEAKATILALYREALKDVSLAETWKSKSLEHEQIAASAAEEIDQAKKDLSEDAIFSMPKVSEDASSRELEKFLADAEKRLEADNQMLAEAEIEPRRRTIRRLEIERLLEEARRRLESLERQEKTLNAEKDSGPLQRARRTQLLAALEAVRREIRGYTQELSAAEATTELLPLNLDLAARDVAMAKKAVKALKKRVAEARRMEAETQVLRASREAAMADPALRDLAEENEELAKQRKELIAKIKQDNEVLSKAHGALKKIKREFARAQSQLASVGRADSITLLTTMQLPLAQPYVEAIETRKENIRDSQISLIKLADQRAKLTIEEAHLPAVDRYAEEDTAAKEKRQHALARQELLHTQKAYVDLLSTELYRHFDLLVEINTTQQKLVHEIDQFQDFIYEQVLWIRSTEPIWEIDDWPSLTSLRSFFDGDSLATPAASLAADFRKYPLPWIAALLALGLLVYGRRDARPALREIGDRAATAGMQRFWPTAHATLLTAMLAVPLLGGLAFVSWRLSTIAIAENPLWTLPLGLALSAVIFLPVEFFRQACRPRGLAECHFDWPTSAVARLHKTLSRLMMMTVPLLALTVTFGKMPDPPWQNTFGRFCFIGMFLVIVFMTHFLLRKKAELYRAFLAQQPEAWLRRAFTAGYFFMVVLPLLFCLIAALGYYFTACRLATNWLSTVLLALTLLMIGAFFLRWILIIRRRMAMERSRLQREAAQKAELTAAGDPAEPQPAVKPVADIGPDLETITLQARRLVFVILSVIGVFGLWLIWNDVLPALGIFKEKELWSVERLSQSGLPIITKITPFDLAWALLILGLTFVAARNIPGLLEISILPQFPIDKGLRYAITTVCRYLLVAIGVVWACNYVGLTWGKVQWILAAMSVGLGFGLQEIFANFASGMVILFERPVRIGDIITIGDATGKVLRIQMRATTIQDWDKKELVVPNKEFATGRLLNWTLTDTLNRLVIDVGVSYKSDPDRVREILLQVAADHPKVVESPKPICIFREFGASALQFSLRIYLASMKGRLNVIHEMHAAIHKALGEAGIEIAYPQLDLHVRSGLDGRGQIPKNGDD